MLRAYTYWALQKSAVTPNTLYSQLLPCLLHLARETTYTSFLLSRSSHKQMLWKSGPETAQRAKISPEAIGCLGVFPTFSPGHTKQQESWWNCRAGNSPWWGRDVAAGGLQWLLWSSLSVLQDRQCGWRKNGHIQGMLGCQEAAARTARCGSQTPES